MSSELRVELDVLGLDDGGDVLLGWQLRGAAPGTRVIVSSTRDDLGVHAHAWARNRGHAIAAVRGDGCGFELVVGSADAQRWHGATRAGASDPRGEGAIADRAAGEWALAARGALVEAGTAPIGFALSERDAIWADEAPQLYAQGAGAQWDPARAIPWDAPIEHAAPIEDAIVQVMTYLIENETAALLVPARFLAQIHPHFREVLQVLALQCADEARHIEVFTRRATLRRGELGTSSAGGQASLRTLLDEPDFALASFLLSVLGEGSFLALLWFLDRHAPDPVTRAVARLAAQDEARHVAFGLAHLQRHVAHEPALAERMIAAVQRRHDALAHTSGLNADVFDALVVIAAGALVPSAIARGHVAVRELVDDMDRGRQKRLAKLGFSSEQAHALSQLHTKNFM
ncbi:MAG TPA: hypothetical protein VG755_41850 [Nannocystaceae bacterium]|nr:hypothetical protein [Nannocystaceae bacterium]